MRAELITRCGCSRNFSVTFPPPPEIQIPLNLDESTRGWLNIEPEDPTDPMRIRRFVLDEKTRPRNPKDCAYYVEHYPAEHRGAPEVTPAAEKAKADE